MDGLKFKYIRGYLTELIIASLTSDLTLNITYIFNSGEKAYAKRLEKYLLWFKLFKGKFMFINIEFFIFFFSFIPHLSSFLYLRLKICTSVRKPD